MPSFICTFIFGLILTLVPLHAQDRDGNTVVEKSGIALIKSQAWSSPTEAEAVKFTAFTDRSARGGAGAGYFILRLPSGKDMQVQVACLVKLVLKPELPKNLLNDSQRQVLQKNIDDILLTTTTLPAARAPLTGYIKPLQDAAARYDSGEVMENGVWLTRQKYNVSLVQKFEFRLHRALLEAKIKKDFDLKSHPDFVKLSEFAENDAPLRERLAAMLTEHAKLVSLENQGEILAKLQTPLSPSDAAPLIAQLKALPDSSLRTASVLKQSATAADLSKDIEAVKQEIEGIWNRDSLSQGKLPQLSTDLSGRIDMLAGKLKVFRAGLPPAGLWVPVAALNSSVALKDGLTLLQARLEAREYRTMVETVDALSPIVSIIGPKTRDAFDLIKVYPNTEISKFSTLVEEGNALFAAGDKKKAASKFKEALAVMPDPGLETRLSEIK